MRCFHRGVRLLRKGGMEVQKRDVAHPSTYISIGCIGYRRKRIERTYRKFNKSIHIAANVNINIWFQMVIQENTFPVSL